MKKNNQNNHKAEKASRKAEKATAKDAKAKGTEKDAKAKASKKRKVYEPIIFRGPRDCGLHITTSHTAKMEGMASASSSCKCNPICAKRQCVAGSICAHCFAQLHLEKPSNQKCFARNTRILKARVYDLDELPIINACFVRIEAFGDVSTVTMARNYIRLVRRNPHATFGIWSKNPAIWARAFEAEGGKPENCTFVLSSMFVNVVADATPYMAFTDHVFTVWSDEAKAKAAGYEINCGARSCLMCRKCYRKDTPFLIHELLK